MKTKGMAMFLTAAVAFFAATQALAESEPPREEETELARHIEEARQALQEAAWRLAELTAGQARTMRDVRIRVAPAAVRLGVSVDPDGDPEAGVLIDEVAEGGPAAKAGLRKGDLLLSINGRSLAASGERRTPPAMRVRDALEGVEPGDAVRVSYRRGRTVRETEVSVEENPDAARAFAFRFGDDEHRIAIPHLSEVPGMMMRLRPSGQLELVKVSEGLGRYFGVDDGLLVVRAGEQNPFDLEDGDVIVSIDGRVPESPVHAQRILRSYAPGENLRLEIVRERQRRTLEVAMPERELLLRGN